MPHASTRPLRGLRSISYGESLMPPILTTGPDPDTRAPTFKCPPGTVDTHIHLFGPEAQYSWDPNTYYTARDATPEMNIALQERLGFSNSVIVSGGAYGRNYTHLAHTLSRFGERFRGVALIPDDLDDAEFVRLSKLGVRGMRVFSASRGGVLPTIAQRISARAHEHGWHVQFYPHGADITEFADRLLALPNTIVLDHFASVKAELVLISRASRRCCACWIREKCGSSSPARCAAHRGTSHTAP